MKKALSLFSVAFGSILIASAQGISGLGIQTTQTASLSNLTGLVSQVKGVVDALIPLAVGVGVVAFFWYLIKFIMQGGQSADAKAASMKGMGYSILAIFVMVSIWGIVGLLGGMLGIGQGGVVPIPRLQ